MLAWNEFHTDPRISYYRYLRNAHGLAAREAHSLVKRMDAMVVGLQGDRRRNSWSSRLVSSPVLQFVGRFVSGSRAYAERNFKPSSRPANWGRRWSDMRPSAL